MRSQEVCASKQLHQMYVALCATNEAMMRASTQEELIDRVCSAAVLGGTFTSVTIAMADANTESLRIVATKGVNAARVESTAFSTSADRPEGRGATGISFRTKLPCIINDYLTDSRTQHWRELVLGSTTRSGASFPLILQDKAIGVILFLSCSRNAFSTELVSLLVQLAENVSFAIGNFHRNEQKQRADEKIRFLACHDALTGLPNRRHFEELLSGAIEQSQQEGTKLAVLFVDLDHFKTINDTFGHSAGDTVLKHTAVRLSSAVHKSDHVARFGGDEFLIILSLVNDPFEVSSRAHRVMAAAATTNLLSGRRCKIGASIGIALYPDDGKNSDVLVRKADAAMYQAKQRGRNCVSFATDVVDPIEIGRSALAEELKLAVVSRQLEVHYQPIVNIASHSVVSMEALVRWRHPRRGLIQPDNFIPIAEEIGLIDQIGEYVLHQAVSDACHWPSCIKVAVNISALQFRNQNIAERVAQILADARLPAARLELEITESVLLCSSEQNLATLHRLRGLGLSIALDDFGTGFSSLSYLKLFPFDKIKIDRSFVSEMAKSDVCAAIVCAVANLGRELGITTTAEGVETDDDLSLLKAAGCTHAQGYFFGRPAPISDAEFLTNIPLTSIKGPLLVR